MTGINVALRREASDLGRTFRGYAVAVPLIMVILAVTGLVKPPAASDSISDLGSIPGSFDEPDIGLSMESFMRGRTSETIRTEIYRQYVKDWLRAVEAQRRAYAEAALVDAAKGECIWESGSASSLMTTLAEPRCHGTVLASGTANTMLQALKEVPPDQPIVLSLSLPPKAPAPGSSKE